MAGSRHSIMSFSISQRAFFCDTFPLKQTVPQGHKMARSSSRKVPHEVGNHSHWTHLESPDYLTFFLWTEGLEGAIVQARVACPPLRWGGVQGLGEDHAHRGRTRICYQNLPSGMRRPSGYCPLREDLTLSHPARYPACSSPSSLIASF